MDTHIIPSIQLSSQGKATVYLQIERVEQSLSHTSGAFPKKIRHTSNRFCFMTILETGCILLGTMIKTEPVIDTQQTRQCVYGIPGVCGRCYIGETGRHLEVHIKAQK
jgi:hypothetical protein